MATAHTDEPSGREAPGARHRCRIRVLCTQVYTWVRNGKEPRMSVTVGVREFRQELADYIDQAERVTVTRHGQTVGLLIPVRRERKAERWEGSVVGKDGEVGV